MVVRLVTWNINGAAQLGDLDCIAGILGELDADLVCLQEVHAGAEGFPSQLDELARRIAHLPFAEILPLDASHHRDVSGRLGVGILSRRPLTLVRRCLLPNPGWIKDDWRTHEKGFLFADVRMAGTLCRVGCGHMLPFHKFDVSATAIESRPLWNRLDELLVAEQASVPLLVGADLNFAHPVPLLPRCSSVGMQAPLEAATTPAHGQQDHVLCSKHWRIDSSSVVRAGPSDHFPCVLEARLCDS